ncbi:phosphotransferase family protein [Pedomonas sp. V897]|uniref:phosphotransferase family protein n=1 Tax=Pedomonas sp. V897 TaxID=3446482 RepID=UPI003EE3C951
MTTVEPNLPIDLAPVSELLESAGVPGARQIESARLLAGGTQNIVLRFSCGGRDYVLRHPPARPRPNSNTLLAREVRLVSALRGTQVPHPALIAARTDPGEGGAVFYVMAAVDGFNPTVGLPAPVLDRPEIRHRMGLGMMDGLASLAAVDPVAVGLGDFGKLDGFLERQVERWAKELESYSRFEGWEGPGALGDVAMVGDWLSRYCPRTMKPGVIHGDYHVGNAIFSEDGALQAIVDWEMATLGDPLVDLGRILISWPDGGEPKPYTMRVERLDGFPTRAEMIERYAARTGRALDDLPWFEVLACYKLGLILEGSHARAQAGLADKATGERLHRSAVALLDHARKIIAGA